MLFGWLTLRDVLVSILDGSVLCDFDSVTQIQKRHLWVYTCCSLTIYCILVYELVRGTILYQNHSDKVASVLDYIMYTALYGFQTAVIVLYCLVYISLRRLLGQVEQMASTISTTQNKNSHLNKSSAWLR